MISTSCSYDFNDTNLQLKIGRRSGLFLSAQLRKDSKVVKELLLGSLIDLCPPEFSIHCLSNSNLDF